jgi:hypothetical protein
MRMLGRFRRSGCGHFGCRLCGPGDVRWAKRSERRDISAEILEGLAAAERGETVDLGSFGQHLDDEDGEP